MGRSKKTTIRRRAAEPSAPEIETPAASETAAAPAEATPAEPTAPRAVLDGAALVAELEQLNATDLAALMGMGAPRRLAPGDQVTGEVVRVSRDAIFVDLGAKSEGTLDRSDMPDGPPPIGSQITAYVLSTGERGIRLATRLRGRAAWQALAQAAETGIPVEGQVIEARSGGFAVRLAGTVAFCPISHIDRVVEADLQAYVGRTMLFAILELRDREVVVSHRKIAEAENAGRAEALWGSVQDGDRHEGRVTSVRPFGVFVDIGGIEGLVPRRSLPRHLPEPQRGESVEVTVTSIDRGAQRLSLSLDGSQGDPWARVGIDYQAGKTYLGTITRVVDFGAFVEVAPGLEGMVHVSKLANERVEHPQDVVSVGQEVRVKVLNVDHERRRLALSMRDAREVVTEDMAPSGPAPKQEQKGLGTFADLFGGLKLKR